MKGEAGRDDPVRAGTSQDSAERFALDDVGSGTSGHVVSTAVDGVVSCPGGHDVAEGTDDVIAAEGDDAVEFLVAVALCDDVGTRGARHLVHARLRDDGGSVTMTRHALSTLS